MTDAQSIAVEAVEEFAAMLDAAEEDPDCIVFDHSPEEIGLHVMKNHQAIRAALAAMPAPSDQEKLVGELVEALREYVYETTHLSPEREDGSHECRITKATLSRARALITRARTQAKGAAS